MGINFGRTPHEQLEEIIKITTNCLTELKRLDLAPPTINEVALQPDDEMFKLLRDGSLQLREDCLKNGLAYKELILALGTIYGVKITAVLEYWEGERC